ncbi:hypothetical protein HAPAU_39710 [Halalkalicoccus paucihalophilus]|uniref:HMA domain-containing protein n=1 Tax=Halalkalicoccus paucihalophilus TaxID=1008153 RepID=A0A151A8R8_9EURY|nr:cation transporter [Halalkalicoccus paucihalophilus]KYH23892.1 hypothetical protein HAPAU_39710 [Halalkalicoccus paucihalophilus]
MAQSTAVFSIQGIDSEEDLQEIDNTLSELDGVMGVNVDQGSGDAEIKYDEDVLAEERVKITVRELGYTVK